MTTFRPEARVLSKIVVGVDQNPSSCDAAMLGNALAHASRADLLVVAAYQDPLLPFPPGLGRGRVHDVQELLGRLRPTFAPDGHTRAVPDYSAAHALRRVALDERADVLVLGSGRKAQAGHVRAGHTGRQVLHGAPCAVAFAVAGLHEQPGPVLRRIVVGVDETPEAEAALTLARDLAVGAGAELTAVSVVDDRLPIEAAPFGEIIELSRWDEVIAERRRHVVAHLERVIGGGAVRTDVRVGEPAQELLDAAHEADLVVVGSRRWGTVERVALGSTSERLAQTAPCSVLVLPRPAAKAAPAPGEGTTAATAAAG